MRVWEASVHRNPVCDIPTEASASKSRTGHGVKGKKLLPELQKLYGNSFSVEKGVEAAPHPSPSLFSDVL